jgi:hypothetical protein
MLVDAPARQNASAMHTSTSSRSNSGSGGVNGSSHLAVSIHAIGKTCRGRSVANLGEFHPFCAVSVPLTRGWQCQPSITIIKIVMIQRPFKFSLS